jgi:hypothetical protein
MYLIPLSFLLKEVLFGLMEKLGKVSKNHIKYLNKQFQICMKLKVKIV